MTAQYSDTYSCMIPPPPGKKTHHWSTVPGVLPYNLGGGVPLGSQKSYPLLDQILQTLWPYTRLKVFIQLFLISIFCEWSRILDQFSMITGLYTNLNGLKTIPLPVAHTCIANIWEYPPPQSTVLLFYWLYLSKTPDSLASECCNILDQNNLPFVFGKIHFFPSQRLCRKLIEWLGQGPNMSCTASCAIQCTVRIQSWAFYYPWNGFEYHVYCTYGCN